MGALRAALPRGRGAGRRARGKPSRVAAPARKARGVFVRRPVVHEPRPQDVGGPAFVVQMQKKTGATPLDPATGLPMQAASPRPPAPPTPSGSASTEGRPGAGGTDSRPAPPQGRSPTTAPSARDPSPAATGVALAGAGAAAAGLTYAGSGVDIGKEDRAIAAIAGAVTFARQGFGAPIGAIGHFAGLVDFGAEDALVLCTDGVGSKVEVANALRKWDTVGVDCVAMNVNDAICVGAEPLAFVDYLAVADPDPELARQVAVGLNEGARLSNCSLVGGETASLPGIVRGFDLAGTCLAHVRKARIVDGSGIRPGDAIIGLAASGIHSNGLSLARKAFASHALDAPWPWPQDRAESALRVGDVLLEPTRIYVREVLALLRSGIEVHGLSHITGSGLRKLRRIRQDVRYEITDPLPVPAVFRRIQELGRIANGEMYRTFNMGMGFCVVVPSAQAKRAVALLRKSVSYPVKVVGKVGEGKGVHHPVGGVH